MKRYLSFEDAVRLFKKWGFVVEPGPRPEEVTLILDGVDSRTYIVYEARMLAQVATVALQVRMMSGRLLSTSAPLVLTPSPSSEGNSPFTPKIASD